MVNLTNTLLRSARRLKYWERYVNNEIFHGYTIKMPYGEKNIRFNRAYKFSEHRPWTEEAKRLNAPGKVWDREYIEPVIKWTIVKGDRVEVLVGPDEGKQGIVCMIVKERNWVFVEGLNCEYNMMKPHPDVKGMMTKTERPLLVTNEVALLDPSDKKPTPAEWRYTEQGVLVRVALRTGRILPLPHRAGELEDYVHPADYKDQLKDSTKEDTSNVTFVPVYKNHEQELMDHYGIKEDRKKTPLYWY